MFVISLDWYSVELAVLKEDMFVGLGGFEVNGVKNVVPYNVFDKEGFVGVKSS